MKGGKPGGGAFVPGGAIPGGPPGMNGGRGPPPAAAANGLKGGMDDGAVAAGFAVSSLTLGERLSESECTVSYLRW